MTINMKTKITLITALFMLSFLVSAQTAPEPADKILEKAYKQAASENGTRIFELLPAGRQALGSGPN
jgi:hypothetical protein